MIHIQIRPYYAAKVQADFLSETASFVLQQIKVEGDASILITGLKEIRVLNAQYRHIDAPTDVLSFPEEMVDPSNQRKYLGDIVICYQVARKHAQEEGHTLENELRLLVTHGILHLLGYDHGNPTERKEMWQIQRELLKKMKVPESIFNHLESDK